jgi:putative ABC transport system permease protein
MEPGYALIISRPNGMSWTFSVASTMIVLRGVRLVAVGAAFGLAGALVAVRFVRVLLFGVEPADPVTWIAVSAVLMLVSLVACALPARRAMRIDPTAVLRSS